VTFTLEIFSLFVCDCLWLVSLCCCWCSFVLQEQRVRLSGSLLVVDEVRTRDFQNTRPQSLMTHPHSITAANICRACQMRKGYDNPGFILAGLTFSLPRPDPCGSEHLINRERLVANQHSLRNYVDHLAALSHVYDFDLNLAYYRPLSTSQGAMTR